MFVFGLVLLGILSLAYADNNDVVVLVHGFNSNAGTWTYADEIRQSGFRVITLDIPPTASNHDRAVSLFAQLKGRRMDYGVCHSEKYGIARFGEDYTGRGLYPEWDSNNRIHLVGHSMGGQTSRALERFLELGSGCDSDTDLLFTGGKDWITSITSLATPHDGTTGVNIGSLRRGEYFAHMYLAQGGNVDDMALPHMGLVRQEGESKEDFFNRAVDDFSRQDNNAIFDLSVEGAAIFNSDGPAIVNEDRYYMAYALERTSPGNNCGFAFRCDPFQVADAGMNLQLKVPANLIGRDRNVPDRPSDGAVNQDRAKCPGDNSKCKQVADDITTWTPGQWHYINVGYLDHFQITRRDSRNDQNNFLESAQRIYLQIGSRLKSLPSKSLNRLSAEDAFEASEKADEVNSYLEAIAFLTSLPVPERKNNGAAAVAFFIFVVGAVVGVFLLKKVRKHVKGSDAHGTIEGQEGTIYKATL